MQKLKKIEKNMHKHTLEIINANYFYALISNLLNDKNKFTINYLTILIFSNINYQTFKCVF